MNNLIVWAAWENEDGTIIVESRELYPDGTYGEAKTYHDILDGQGQRVVWVPVNGHRAEIRLLEKSDVEQFWIKAAEVGRQDDGQKTS
jgi:hypothetical protein